MSKQPPEQLREKAIAEGITHRLISINHDAAVALGVALTPDKGPNGEDLADTEFWNNALCRTLITAGINNLVEGISTRIYHIEQLADQAKQPNIEAAVLVAAA